MIILFHPRGMSSIGNEGARTTQISVARHLTLKTGPTLISVARHPTLK